MTVKMSTMPFKSILFNLIESHKIRAIDYAFAEFIYQQELSLNEEQRLCIALVAAYVSVRTGEQHTCLTLSELNQPWLEYYEFPSVNPLLALLQQSKCIASIGSNNANSKANAKPLVLDAGNLYLQRYWTYEVNLAAKISKMSQVCSPLNVDRAKQLIGVLFNDDDKIETNELNWQKIAVAISSSQKFSVITGGPGTGKTTTVTKLLALLQGLALQEGKALTIQLVAPTGKAAARLTESIGSAKGQLPVELQKDLPEKCQTIHRLLGAKPHSPYFKANETNPLHVDVLVLDEASMVDLPLMAKLFSALPESAQIILLGDQEQLASVETGSVLSDICQANAVAEYHHPLTQYSQTFLTTISQLLPELNEVELSHTSHRRSHVDNNTVRLLKSHRFDEYSGIGQLAKQVKEGDFASAQLLLKSRDMQDLFWLKLSSEKSRLSYAQVSEQILKTLVLKLIPVFKLYVQALKQNDLKLAFNCLYQQQVLCAQKSGHWGVNQLNDVIEGELNKQGLINRASDFYVGRPIMLNKNDHALGLFNGDMGIVMSDPKNNSLLKVWFLTPDGEIRGVLPSRLPAHDTLYAMTIHKSQGSEFENVHMCLPLLSAGNQGRGLSRELLYTGLTRAKKQFHLYAQPKALSLCLSQQCVRASGLAKRLWV